MIYLGDTGSAFLEVDASGSSLRTNGPKEKFLGYKLDSVDSRNGMYCQWAVSDDCMTLTNDAFGIYPMFYAETPNGVSFSSSIPDLLQSRSDVTLDDAAIAVFLRFGSFIGESTPFSEISSVPPGAQIKFDRSGLSMSSERVKPQLDNTITRSQAEILYGELFHQSVNKFQSVFPGNICVPLSGGRDSRHILFELASSGLRPSACLTMKYSPPSSNEDARIAKLVSDHLKIKHVFLEPDNTTLNAELRKNRITNFCTLEHSWALRIGRYLAQENFVAVFDGIGGDVLSQSLHMNDTRLELFRKKKFEALADDFLGPEHSLPDLLAPEVYKRFNRNLAKARIEEELKKHAECPNPIGQFVLWNRTRRNIGLSSWRMTGQGLHVFAPYLDLALYEFLASLPAEYFMDHTFHESAISARFPDYSQLPYASKATDDNWSSLGSSYRPIAQLMRFFADSFSSSSPCRGLYLYPRFAKSLLSTRYFDQTRDAYRVPIYLTQLYEYLRRRKRPSNQSKTQVR